MSTSFQIDASTLLRYMYFETADMEEARQRIAAVLQPYRLIPGPLHPGQCARMNHLRLRHLAFGSLSYGRPMTVEAGDITDYHLIIIVLAGVAQVSVGELQASLGKGQGVLLTPGTRFGATFSGDCEQFFLRIDKAAFDAHGGLERGRMAPHQAFATVRAALWGPGRSRRALSMISRWYTCRSKAAPNSRATASAYACRKGRWRWLSRKKICACARARQSSKPTG
nr:hypothetical protein [Janthinobacterium sp. PC23-8]